MKIQFLIGYTLALLLAGWSLLDANLEFLFYAATVALLLAILHATQSTFAYPNFALWGVVIWVVMHILGGLLQLDGEVLYNKILIPIIAEPYSVLKYDQVVHCFCYFVMCLLMWRVVIYAARPDAARSLLVFLTVLCATAVGGINEIIEFIATISLPNTNVGGYENTAIDIICNLLGAILAIPFLRLEKD